jgi:hypothetical protein
LGSGNEVNLTHPKTVKLDLLYESVFGDVVISMYSSVPLNEKLLAGPEELNVGVLTKYP